MFLQGLATQVLIEAVGLGNVDCADETLKLRLQGYHGIPVAFRNQSEAKGFPVGIVHETCCQQTLKVIVVWRQRISDDDYLIRPTKYFLDTMVAMLPIGLWRTAPRDPRTLVSAGGYKVALVVERWNQEWL